MGSFQKIARTFREEEERPRVGHSLMIEYREEASGVYRVTLYRPSACRAVLAWSKAADGWASAVVNEQAADGTSHEVLDDSYRSASILYPEPGTKVRLGFDERMTTIVRPLVKRVWRKELSSHKGTQIVRYRPGGHYDLHSDTGPSTRNRYFSVVCYLNDDFDGGRTTFPSLDYSATPAAGTALVFPSNYSHCAEPVVSGEKYVVVSWVLGPTN
jgi:hypothetical protein